MQNEKLINRIAAAFAFLASLFIYLRTIAPTVSFWDCGEFIACSHILGIPHPPGAPLYLLIGRIFSMIPFAQDIALRVNLISALTSALTVMLAYLIIVRLIKQWRGTPKSNQDLFILVFSGLLGALSFAFTDTFWFNAVEAEVYAISMFFTAIIFWLILVWLEKTEENGSERYLLLIAYLVGLAIGVHLQMILMLPAVFMIVYYKVLELRGEKITLVNILVLGLLTAVVFAAIYPGIVQWLPRMAGKFSIWSVVILLLFVFSLIIYAVKNKKTILAVSLMAFFLVVTGYSTYTMLYIRSGLNPAIDENDPETMENMVKYVNREQYGTWGWLPRRYPGIRHEYEYKQMYPNRSYAMHSFNKQMDFLWNYQIKKMYLRYFSWQFIGKGATLGQDGFIQENLTARGLFALPFLIGLIGMVHHFYRHWRHALSIFAILILTGVAIVLYLNQEDPQARERDYVYVGSFFAFSIWIGMGLTALLEWVQEAIKKPRMLWLTMAGITLLLFIVSPVKLLAFNYESHDRTGNYVAYDYSYNILQSCEPDAILFTNGDNDTFPLWFLQFVNNIRPDVRVVNLSLLNTPWYIKQLKTEEPRVPISLSLAEIDQLDIMRWQKQTLKIPVPDSERLSALAGLQRIYGDDEIPEPPVDHIRVEVAPTILGQGLRVQDFMILNIIYANNWRKPVYFAVTVSNDNKLNFDDYLRMDGLTFKLVPYRVDRVDTELLEKNLTERFQYRNLNNPDVYFNDNIVGLLQNYRAAYLRLVREYFVKEDYKKLEGTLDFMQKVLPEEVIPIPDFRLSMQLGKMYELVNRPEEYISRLRLILSRDPENVFAYGSLVSSLENIKQYDEAIELLEKWLKDHPEDREAVTRLEAIRAKAESLRADTTNQTLSSGE